MTKPNTAKVPNSKFRPTTIVSSTTNNQEKCQKQYMAYGKISQNPKNQTNDLRPVTEAPLKHHLLSNKGNQAKQKIRKKDKTKLNTCNKENPNAAKISRALHRTFTYA